MSGYSMAVDDAAAIVVTYNPDPEAISNLSLLRDQVGVLIVVDNGSSPQTRAPLEAACHGLGCILIAKQENLGIAAGLNLGAQRAIELGCHWLLLFDQDSSVRGAFTADMLKGYAAIATTYPLGILVPRHLDRMLGSPLPVTSLRDGSLATAMTSGSLLSVGTFQRLGPFEESLFIDSVDHAFSLRVREAGLAIRTCEEAVLLHSPGNPRPHKLLGRFKFYSTNYGPLRRYYQERNKIWMYRRYGWKFPGFCFAMFLRSFVDLAKIWLVEPDTQLKTRFFLRGIVDGLRGRMGRLDS